MPAESPESQFWRWFCENEPWLFELEADQERIFDELSAQLRNYKDGLTFEISARQDGMREFIISADGIRDSFPSVMALADAAPDLKQWHVIAFRPRMDDYTRYSLDYAGDQFDPKSIWFQARIEDGSFDVIFYHQGYSDESRNRIISGTYILLDMAIGEFDVVTGIRYIDHQQLPGDPEAEGLRPFRDFRAVFDGFKSEKG